MMAHPVQMRRRRPGALGVVALLFAMSALIRLGEDTGRAMAQAMDGAAGTPAAAGPGESALAADAELRVLLADLQMREDAIATREAQVADRVQALALAETAIEERLAALESAEERLSATIAITDSAAEEDLAKLTAVYESMKPKDAAALFESMAPEFSAGFLGRMRPASAAAVMAGLTPDRAYAVSLVLAGRNAAAPTE